MVSQQSFERFARYVVLRAGFAVACLLAVISNAGGASPPAKRTPNIVLILIDNLGKDWIGCYGSDETVTPHIDALAASGVRFQHAWVTAMCSTTRAAMLTGRYGFRTGWHTHHDTAIYGGGYFDWEREHWSVHPVAQKEPNAFGLHDMVGNVRNWCADWYDEAYYVVSALDDPRGPTSGTHKVVRGSAFHYRADFLRSATRFRDPASHRHGQLGFRICRSVK